MGLVSVKSYIIWGVGILTPPEVKAEQPAKVQLIPGKKGNLE